MTQAQIVRPTGTPYVPPARKPRSSILDIAHVQEGVGFLSPEGLVWSYNCVGVAVSEVDCVGFTGQTKRFDSPANTDGAMFVVQAGLRCKPFGFNADDPGIKAAFAAEEPEGVSLGLHDTLFATATDITPGAGTSLAPDIALGLLEGYGHLNYAGEPIIHIGPGMVSMLATTGGAVQRQSDGTLTTLLGTPIAVSGGYEETTAGKLDPDQWGYVTGAMVLARSDPIIQSELDRTTNDMTVLYERLYVVGIDCLLGKVKVKVF